MYMYVFIHMYVQCSSEVHVHVLCMYTPVCIYNVVVSGYHTCTCTSHNFLKVINYRFLLSNSSLESIHKCLQMYNNNSAVLMYSYNIIYQSMYIHCMSYDKIELAYR